MIIFYGLVLSLLYGIIAAAQVLGFLGLYQPLPTAALSILLTALAAFLYFREHSFPKTPSGSENPNPDLSSPAANKTSLLSAGFIAAAMVLFILLIALPLLRWPASPIGRSLTWDAGAYHFPKAVELYRSASTWDLSVPYGDYPFGYESLLSFGLTLTGDETLFGTVHLLGAAFFCLTLWRLARRYTNLPSGFLLFLSVCALVVGVLLGGGRTWLLSGYALTIGKNDFLLGAAVLAVILHSPAGRRKAPYQKQSFQLFSLAIAAMIALSVKPNALGVVGPVGLFVIFEQWRLYRRNKIRFPWRKYLLAIALALPGILWAIRNLIVLGVVFTPAAGALSADSIFNNLGNPYLYSLNFPFGLLLTTFGLVLAGAVGLLLTRSLSPSIVAVQALLFLTFIITPATAFHRVRDVPSHIAWRFGVSLLAYSILIALLLLEIPLQRLFLAIKQRSRSLTMTAFVCIWIVTAAIVWRGRWITVREPQNAWILQDQFSESVGIDGYWSAYDYVQQNIQDSVIHIENGLAYYLYGPGYTNTPTKLQYPLEMEDKVPQPVPEYFVTFRRAWESEKDEGEFPASLASSSWQDEWVLLYDDSEGRVYQKRSQ
jgi:hypothetical protein